MTDTTSFWIESEPEVTSSYTDTALTQHAYPTALPDQLNATQFV